MEVQVVPLSGEGEGGSDFAQDGFLSRTITTKDGATFRVLFRKTSKPKEHNASMHATTTTTTTRSIESGENGKQRSLSEDPLSPTTPVKKAKLARPPVDKPPPPTTPCSSATEAINGATSSSTHTGAKIDHDAAIRRLLKEKNDLEHKLRKLRLVETYHQKPEMKNIDEMIAKWREVCQEAIADVASMKDDFNEKKVIEHMGISPELIGFSVEDEEFT